MVNLSGKIDRLLIWFNPIALFVLHLIQIANITGIKKKN